MNLHAPEELSSKETSLDGFESQLYFSRSGAGAEGISPKTFSAPWEG